jgi:hypothetical protein
MKNIINSLQLVLEDIKNGRNFDSYIAIIFGFVFALLGAFNVVGFSVLSAVILLSLTLLVTSSLENKRAIRKIEEASLQSNNEDKIIRNFEIPVESLQQYLRKAKEIYLLGISLYRFLPMFNFDIEYALNNGCDLKIILVAPRSDALRMASFRSPMRDSMETENQRIEGTLAFVGGMKARLPNAKIQIKLLDYLPPYGMTIIRPQRETDRAYCNVRLLPFQSSAFESPIINPDPIKDKLWFDFFSNQFQKMWEAGTDGISSKLKSD